MTPPKLFVTGVTGYIGGDILHAIITAHPDWDITCLVRTAAKGAKVEAAYPRTRLVYGGLDDFDLIKEEAEKADIVIHTADASDHAPSANAIAAGISTKKSPGFWIHTSGTGILTYPDIDRNTYGEPDEKLWDDIENIDDIIDIPSHAPHRDVDTIVLSVHEKSPTAHTAIVCPPTIYGTGRGPDSTTSRQVPSLARSILQRKQGFMVGAGKNVWSSVHVHDLSKVYLALAEAAAAGGEGVSWDKQGYYFASAGEFVWGKLAESLTATAHKLGYLASPDVDLLPADKVAEITDIGPQQWGTNSRSRASRAREELKWDPVMPGIEDDEFLAEVVKTAAKALGS